MVIVLFVIRFISYIFGEVIVTRKRTNILTASVKYRYILMFRCFGLKILLDEINLHFAYL